MIQSNKKPNYRHKSDPEDYEKYRKARAQLASNRSEFTLEQRELTELRTSNTNVIFLLRQKIQGKGLKKKPRTIRGTALASSFLD